MKLNYSLPAVSFLGDLRLDRRFIKLINGLTHNIGKSIAHNLVKWGQIKAAYRFIAHKKVTHHRIMAIEETRLIKDLIQKDVPLLNGSRRVVLHLQDTTTFNLSAQKGTRQLPCLNGLSQRGYFGHTSLLSCLEGVLNQTVWRRDEGELGTNKHFKTLQTSIPSDNVDLIVRSQFDRDIVMPNGTPQKLNAYLAALPVQGYTFINVLKKYKHNYRLARLTIRFGEITVKIPDNLKWSGVIPRAARRLNQKMADRNGLKLRERSEVDAEAGCKPIHWTILTTLPVNNYCEAVQVTEYCALVIFMSP